MFDFLKKIFGLQKYKTEYRQVNVAPGNAIVTEYKNAIGQVYGSGTVFLRKGERITAAFDLRPQFELIKMENVVTADLIPLTIRVSIGYCIKPADPDDDEFSIIKERNYGLFPVHPETLIKATYNVGIGGWKAWVIRVVRNQVRKHILSYSLIEVYALKGSGAENSQRIRQIGTEVLNEINSFSPHSVGITVFSVNILQIILPDELEQSRQKSFGSKEDLKITELSVEQQKIILTRRLQKLKERCAIKGIDIEPHYLIEIEDIEVDLKELTQQNKNEMIVNAAQQSHFC